MVVMRLPDGTMAFVKLARARPRRCAVCRRPASLQCDYPVADGKTCDKHLCRECAVHVGPDRDYCWGHPAVAPGSVI